MKDRIQVLANRLNGNDLIETLGKISEALEKLTIQQQESTPNAAIPKGLTSETKPPVHARPPAMNIVTTISAKLREIRAPFKAQRAGWTASGI